MVWQRESFRDYFIDVLGGKASSFNTYSSYLNRIDAEIGGLDERLSSDGVQPVRDWALHCSTGPFETYQTQARSILNSYLGFIEAGGEAAALGPTTDVDGSEDDPQESQALFKLEKEMQQAVRADISSLEAGLEIVDGGSEKAVSTGKIDILAKDPPLNRRHLDDLHVVPQVAHCDAVVFERLGGDFLAVEQARGEVVEALALAGIARYGALVAFDQDAPALAGQADVVAGQGRHAANKRLSPSRRKRFVRDVFLPETGRGTIRRMGEGHPR